jgi:hypothetical protein
MDYLPPQKQQHEQNRSTGSGLKAERSLLGEITRSLPVLPMSDIVPSTSITLQDLQKTMLSELSQQVSATQLEDLKYCVGVMLQSTVSILDLNITPFTDRHFRFHVKEILFALCLGYAAYQVEIPERPADLWGDSTEPNMDMVKAKLVRYASNLYACTYAYPETVLESNLDYDLRQYLTFLYVFTKHHGVDLLDLAREYIELS